MRATNILALLAAAAVTAGCSSDSSESGDSGGEKMTVVYEAGGAGRADLIRYVDVSTERVVHMDEGADLPWRKEATGRKSVHVSLSVSAAEEKAEVTCRLTVDGKEVASETGPTIVECKLPSAG